MVGVSPNKGQPWMGKKNSDPGFNPYRMVAPWYRRSTPMHNVPLKDIPGDTGIGDKAGLSKLR